VATFRKDIVVSFGSLEQFAQMNGYYKIYESERGYHTVQVPSDEEAVLANPDLKDLRLVWPEPDPIDPA
jgi:hypothetical protein